jgi:hypothetical protein
MELASANEAVGRIDDATAECVAVVTMSKGGHRHLKRGGTEVVKHDDQELKRLSTARIRINIKNACTPVSL